MSITVIIAMPTPAMMRAATREITLPMKGVISSAMPMSVKPSTETGRRPMRSDHAPVTATVTIRVISATRPSRPVTRPCWSSSMPRTADSTVTWPAATNVKIMIDDRASQ